MFSLLPESCVSARAASPMGSDWGGPGRSGLTHKQFRMSWYTNISGTSLSGSALEIYFEQGKFQVVRDGSMGRPDFGLGEVRWAHWRADQGPEIWVSWKERKGRALRGRGRFTLCTCAK